MSLQFANFGCIFSIKIIEAAKQILVILLLLKLLAGMQPTAPT